MVKRIAFQIVSLCLMGCCALSQETARGTSTNAVLPDAPSAVQIGEAELDEAAAIARTPAPGDWERVAPSLDKALTYQLAPARKDPELLTKLFNPDRSWQHTRYQASERSTVMGRATDAASRVFLTRDESGRRHVNASYFVVMLTSVAAQRAERPYWLRSNSATAPLSNVGSTVGNDAGMNLLHEFGPGLRQAVTGHLPGFVYKIQERIMHDVASR